MEYEEKLERMKALRAKYPRLNLLEKGSHLIDLIFKYGEEDGVYEEYFKDLEQILEKAE
jgi:hypothetical protein